MQILTVEDVKKAAREAHKADRLTAQAPDPKDRKCVYRHGDRCCAVGAALTDATVLGIQGINNGYNVVRLHSNGLLEFESIEDLHGVSHIQTAHDGWCQSEEDDRGQYEREFLRLIAE